MAHGYPGNVRVFASDGALCALCACADDGMKAEPHQPRPANRRSPRRRISGDAHFWAVKSRLSYRGRRCQPLGTAPGPGVSCGSSQPAARTPFSRVPRLRLETLRSLFREATDEARHGESRIVGFSVDDWDERATRMERAKSIAVTMVFIVSTSRDCARPGWSGEAGTRKPETRASNDEGLVILHTLGYRILIGGQCPGWLKRCDGIGPGPGGRPFLHPLVVLCNS